MVLLLFCCLTIVTIQAVSELSPRAKHVQSLCQKATALVNSEELDEAIVHYHAAINYCGIFKVQEPIDMPLKIWAELGQVYKQRYLLHKPRYLLKPLLKKNRDKADLVQALVCFKKATDVLNKMCQQDVQPNIDFNELRNIIGVMSQEKRMKSRDKRDLKHALVWLLKKTVDQGNFEAIEQQALRYMSSGHLKQAEECLSILVKNNYHTGPSLYNIGVCRRTMKDDQGALRVWRMAVNLERHADAAFALGHYYKAIGDRENAQQWFNKAAKYRNDDEQFC